MSSCRGDGKKREGPSPPLASDSALSPVVSIRQRRDNRKPARREELVESLCHEGLNRNLLADRQDGELLVRGRIKVELHCLQSRSRCGRDPRFPGRRYFRVCRRLDRCLRCFSIPRSEEHTSELQSLMRLSYAV